MRRWWRAAKDWYLNRYHLVALIDHAPIAGGMAPLPLLLELGDGTVAPGTGAGGALLMRRRRRS